MRAWLCPKFLDAHTWCKASTTRGLNGHVREDSRLGKRTMSMQLAAIALTRNNLRGSK